MTFRDNLHDSTEYRAAVTQAARESGTAETAGQAVDPVISLEKTDIQFWADVATVILLFLIWRELSQGGR